jgi:hypothetical protein
MTEYLNETGCQVLGKGRQMRYLSYKLTRNNNGTIMSLVDKAEIPRQSLIKISNY